MNKTHAILVFGPFGLGKSSFVSLLAEELLKKPDLKGKKVRLYTAEHYNSVQDAIDEGWLEVWKFNTRNQPWETLRRAADGFWPVDPLDPESPLVAPTKETFEQYPIRIYEGLATAANYVSGGSVIGGMTERIGHGQQIGPTDSGELVKIMDGEEGIGGLSRSNYGFVQNEMISIIQRSQKRPGYIIWTSHESSKEETRGKVKTGKTVLGPEVKGSGLTATIGREFADCWRIVGVPKDVGERRIIERRLYLKEHTDEGLIAKAKNSRPMKQQDEVKDYIRLTDAEKPWVYRPDAAEVLVKMLKL